MSLNSWRSLQGLGVGVGLHDKGDEVIMRKWQEITNTLVYINGVIKYSEIINDPVYLSYELAIQKAQLIL